jgi:glutathione synthase/RimK-type ligase-like ATP-grasp enzyme
MKPMSIALLYERSETDEMGLRLTAEKLGIDLTFIPFRKIAFSISKNGFSAKTKGKDYSDVIENTAVVLNRAQSKNRRIMAAYLMEMLGKKTLNSSQIEFICFSKFRTLLHFWTEGIPIPKTIFVPCDPIDVTKSGKIIHNEADIADLFQDEIALEKGIVIKPDAGTHGKQILLAKNRQEIVTNISETKASIINPVGLVAQELIQKWFYDLRIIVYKEKGKAPICHPVALARAGFKDFRTNTYLGNLVFDSKLPLYVREIAVKSGVALGKENEAWVFALDAMIEGAEDKTLDNEYIKSELDKANLAFEEPIRVKADETRLRDFPSWNEKLEAAFSDYMRTEPYEKVKNIIEENVERNKYRIVFHEANSCPEFWENTRIIAGINVAVPLLEGAKSLL